MPSNAPVWAFWLMIGISVVLGIVVGVVCCKFYRVGMFLLGALFGAVLGLILFSAFISRFSQQAWVVGLVVGLCAVAFGFVAWFTGLTGIIVATSLVGSYMVVRACSWYIRGYPNEWTLAQDIKQNGWKSYWKFYIYMIVMLLLAAVGIVVQHKMYKNKEEAKDLEAKLVYFRIGSQK